MKKHLLPFAFVMALLTSACGTAPRESATTYDFGMLPPQPAMPQVASLPPLVISNVTAPDRLATPDINFRLAYTDSQQPRSYAFSQWSMPPAKLFEERLKSHIGQAGGEVLSGSTGISGLPELRIEIEDFSHIFETPEQSHAHVVARVAAIDGRKLISQKTFRQKVPAPSTNAEGGAKALAQASDAMIADILRWLSSLPLKQ